MKRILTWMSVAMMTFALNAQVLQVGAPQRVSLPQGVRAEQAKLSPDGTHIALTDMAGTLKVVDRTTSTVSTISANGSMMDLAFNDDGRAIVYREATQGTDNLRRVSVKSYVIATASNTQIAAPSRELQAVVVDGNVATFVDNGHATAAAVSGSRVGAPASVTTKAVPSVDRGRLYLTANGKRTLCSPLGTAGMSYLWPSVSPDGSKLLFFAAGYGTYTCNIDGTGLQSLGWLYAPVWYDDDTVVGMYSRDDGRVTYEASIIAAKADGSAYQTLTDSSLVAVLPDATPGRITFTTTDGDMYIINVSK